jgi:hypothetical protein
MRDRWSAGRRAMSVPLKPMRPADGLRSPDNRLISVDLPAPFGPTSA